MANSDKGNSDFQGPCAWDHTLEEEGVYRELPPDDDGITHEYGGLHDESKACPEDLSELSTTQLCAPRPTRIKSGRRGPLELSQNEVVSSVTAASLASNEHLQTNVFLHHVRYEIGEHPLADIISLTGGGGVGVPVLVGMLVPGGKAEQAGVATGDELVAVSGRADFQRLVAERLLESLPTPTLLVFAKEAKLSQTTTQTQKQRGEKAAPTTWNTLSSQRRMDGFTMANYGGEGTETFDRHTPGWLNNAVDGVFAGEADGFAGASWEVGINLEPVLGEPMSGGSEDMAWRQTISSKRAAGITRYNSEPLHSTETEMPAPKPPSVQLAIIQRDDMSAGLPSGHSLFGPNVQVELCDQVVFNTSKATLWMQGVQHYDTPVQPLARPSPASRRSGNSGAAWEHDKSLQGTAEGLPTWMYELPRKEARRLVETARRDASRADRSTSRQDTGERTDQTWMENTVSDLDVLAFSREAKATTLFPDRDRSPRHSAIGSRGVSARTAPPGWFDIIPADGMTLGEQEGGHPMDFQSFYMERGDTLYTGSPFSAAGLHRSSLNPNAGPSASSTMSSTSPLSPPAALEAPSPKFSTAASHGSHAGVAVSAEDKRPTGPLDGPRLGPSARSRGSPPSRVDPPDSDDGVTPEDDLKERPTKWSAAAVANVPFEVELVV